MSVYGKTGIFSGGKVTKYGSNEIRISPYILGLLSKVPTGASAPLSTRAQGTGTVSTTSGSAIVTGVGTSFTTELVEGGNIIVGDEEFIIKTISSNTSLIAIATFNATNSGSLFYYDSYGPAKTLELTFGNVAPTAPAVNRTSTQIPSYKLNLNNAAAGQAWLFFNIAIKDFDLSVNVSPPSNQPIFAKLTWPTNTTNISQIAINTTARTEAYINETSNPQSAEKGLYADGQRWVAGANNIPLSNMAIFMEVLQVESQLSFGNDYFVTLINLADISADALTVIVAPFKSFSRKAATNSYIIYNTKENDTLSPAGTAVKEVFDEIPNGEVISLVLEKSTGIPSIVTSFNSALFYQIAYANVDESVTDLADVDWIIVNNLGGITDIVENQANSIRSLHTTGFFRTIELEATEVANTFRFKTNIFNLYGYLLNVIDTNIDLGAPPTTGARRDFVYMQVKKKSVPWTQLEYEFRVVNDCDNVNYPDPFAEPSLIENDDSNAYTYDANGYYKAEDSANEVDGFTYAIPIALIHRFNTGAYNSSSNRNGAGSDSRADGKSPTILNLQEIENRSPVAKKPDYNRATMGAIRKVLKGLLNHRLQPALLDSNIYSRAPFQIDRLSTSDTPQSGTSFIGLADNIRFYFGNDHSKEIWMYGIIDKTADSGTEPYNSPAISFDIPSNNIHIQVPTSTEGQLVLDEDNQPIIVAKWVTTGADVVFTNPTWTVELAPRVMSNTIDDSDAAYIAAGDEFVIMFKIKYTDPDRIGLSAIPSNLISASIGNDFDTLANTYAIATENYAIPTFIKELTRSTTISSVAYKDKLYLQQAGDTYKFYTYQMHYVKNRQVSADYVIPDTVNDNGTYSILGVVEARKVLTDELLNITKITLSGGNFTVTLTDNAGIPVNTPIKFVLACAGDTDKQVDLEIGSLAIKNITQSLMGQITSDGNTDGFYRYAGNDSADIKGRIIYGFSSAQFTDIDPVDFKAFVGEDLVPVVVNGLGTNLITIDFTQEDISNFDAGNWAGAGPYYPDNGVTLQFGVLLSNRLNDNLYFQYQYNSLPFIAFKPANGDDAYNDYLSEPRLPYDTGDGAVVLHRGLLLLSTDGIGNGQSTVFSPVSERLPVVQGVDIIGENVPSNTGLSDILNSGIEQLNDLIVEGIPITFDDNIGLGLTVEAGTSVAAWFALIKQVNLLRLFLFEIRDGQFVLNEDNVPQAFVCELEENYREVYK